MINIPTDFVNKPDESVYQFSTLVCATGMAKPTANAASGRLSSKVK